MKNRDRWKPNKYVYKRGKLIASRDPDEVGFGSRLIIDIVAEYYDINIKKYASGKLLDLGCGKVPLYHVYKDYVTDNVCIDWGNTIHQSSHLDYECDLTKKLNFQNGEFDTIILSDVLEHIPQPDSFWQEIARVLSSGGKILLNVPFFYWIHENPYDYYRYTEFALRRFVESSGLSLVLLKPIGGFPEIMTDIFAKNILLCPIIGKPLACLSQWLTSIFIKTSIGCKISTSSGRRFPLGYFVVAEKL